MILLISLIFSNTALLLSQNFIESSFELKETMYFKRGDNFTGDLISIKLNQKLDPMTGFTSKVVFKPNDKLKVSPKLTGGTMNDGQYYIFDVKDIRKIETKIIRKRKNRFYIFSPLPKIFVWSKELYSDEMQKEYSGREEIDLIINNGMKEISQIEKDEIRRLKTSINIGCAGLSIMLYSALSCGGNC